MRLVKSIITLFLGILYILFLGMFSFHVKFPDDTEVNFESWIVGD